MKSKVSDIGLKLLHPRYHYSDYFVCHEVYMDIPITWYHQRSLQEGENRHYYPAIHILKKRTKAIVVKKKQIFIIFDDVLLNPDRLNFRYLQRTRIVDSTAC